MAEVHQVGLLRPYSPRPITILVVFKHGFFRRCLAVMALFAVTHRRHTLEPAVLIVSMAQIAIRGAIPGNMRFMVKRDRLINLVRHRVIAGFYKAEIGN
jgi:hypothetical protein